MKNEVSGTAGPILMSGGYSCFPALACPSCQRFPLDPQGGGLKCPSCNQVFGHDSEGYFNFLVDNSLVSSMDTTTEDYASTQETASPRIVDVCLAPYLFSQGYKRVLDVGCGVGGGVKRLLELGYEAYGTDVPSMSRFWSALRHSPLHLFGSDACQLPFRSNYFDFVFAGGIIEHIGTLNGHCTLSEDYRQARKQFARELIRVVRPNGSLIVTCPNKTFPLDVQHDPWDGQDRTSLCMTLRVNIYTKTGINIHPPWGRYHLLSYGELKELFCRDAGASSFSPLPLTGWFGFTAFKRGFLTLFGRFAELYIDHLPSFLRASAFNPYVVVEVRK